MIHINNPTVKQVRDLAGNTIFGVTFTKKSGEQRTMQCRLGCQKGQKGGSNNQEAYDNLMTVFEVGNDKFYKTVNLDTTTKMSIRGNKYLVGHTL